MCVSSARILVLMRLFLPASFGDDHLGSDLVEPLPQLGALQLHPDVSLRPARARQRLGFRAGRLTVLALRCGGVRVTGSTCLLHLTAGMFTWRVKENKTDKYLQRARALVT